MSGSLIPRSLWSFPSFRLPSFLGEGEESSEENWLQEFTGNSRSGLSIYEEDKNIVIEAALPGIKPENIEISFDKGILWIKGEQKEEENKNKKYYRKAANYFSYRVAIPGNIDETQQPEACCKEGILKVCFPKTAKAEPRKIQIKQTKDKA